MSLPGKNHWPETLADHHGVWCIFCLDYIKSTEEYEEHHVLPQTYFRNHLKSLFPPSFPVSWTVPTHAKCHVGHHADGYAVQNYVHRILEIRDPEQRDRVAQLLHDSGCYWLSLITKVHTRRNLGASLNPRERYRLFERELASAAGIRSRVNPFSSGIIRDLPDQFKAPVLYHLANTQSNRGALRAARQTFADGLEWAPKMDIALRELSALSKMIRMAQIERNANDAREARRAAVRISGYGSYSHLTALLISAWIQLSETSGKGGIRDNFQAILYRTTKVSWLYIAEAIFGLGCLAALSVGMAETAYMLLTKAQFIYVMLGLQGTPHPELPSRLGVGKFPACLPGHIILANRSIEELKASQCLRLRQEATGTINESNPLYLMLMDDLSGRVMPGDRANLQRAALRL